MHKRRQLPLPDERAPISRREKPVPPPPSDGPSGPAPPLPSRPMRLTPKLPKEEDDDPPPPPPQRPHDLSVPHHSPHSQRSRSPVNHQRLPPAPRNNQGYFPPPPERNRAAPLPPRPGFRPHPKLESVSSDTGQEMYDDFEDIENYEDQAVYDDGDVGEVYEEADDNNKPPPPPPGRRLPPPPKMVQDTYEVEPEPQMPAAPAYPEETYEVTDEPQDTYDEFDVAAPEEEQFDQDAYDEFDVAVKEEEHFDEIQDEYDEFEVGQHTPNDVYEPVEESFAPPPPPPPPSRPKAAAPAPKKQPPPAKNAPPKPKPAPPSNKPVVGGLDLSAITGQRNQLKKVDKAVLKKESSVEEKVYQDENTEFKSIFAKFKQRAEAKKRMDPDIPTDNVPPASPQTDFKSKFKMFEKKKETPSPLSKPPGLKGQSVVTEPSLGSYDRKQHLSPHVPRKASLPPVPSMPENKSINHDQDQEKPPHTRISPVPPPFRRAPSPKVPEQYKDDETSHIVPVHIDEGWSPSPRKRSSLPKIPVQLRGKSPSPPPIPNNRPPPPPPVDDNKPPSIRSDSPPPPPPPKIESVPDKPPPHGYSQVNLPKPPDEVTNGDNTGGNDDFDDDEDGDIYDDAMSNLDPLIGEPYYFKDLSRHVGESKLRTVGKDGAFLIRDSSKGGGKQPYTLMVMYKSKMYNLKIRERIDGKYALGEEKADEMAFLDVKAMVDYHRENDVILVHKTGQYKTCLEYFPKN